MGGSVLPGGRPCCTDGPFFKCPAGRGLGLRDVPGEAGLGFYRLMERVAAGLFFIRRKGCV